MKHPPDDDSDAATRAERGPRRSVAPPNGGDDEPVRQIGVYRVERALRSGGMGEVFLAYDERLGRRVAIKRIRSDKSESQQHRVRLRREARAVASLNHPFVAQVHDVVFDEAADAIVMEYVEGATVADLLDAERLDGALAASLAVQVAEGLAAAHDQGLVHRDLKAENVMVTPSGHAKILDFGLVKRVTDEKHHDVLTEKGMLVGTFRTMSPEQAAGLDVDARSDLFSFGVLLYEMFTGSSPFGGGKWWQVLEAVRSERHVPAHELRPELPRELSELIEHLLEKDPAARPANAHEVVAELRRITAATDLGRLPPAPLEEGAWVPSDAPTGPFSALDKISRTLSALPGRRPWAIRPRLAPVSVAFLALAAAVVLSLVPFLRSETADEPTSVLVLPPRLIGGDAALRERTAHVVWIASVAALGSIEGLEVRRPDAAADGPQAAAHHVLDAEGTCTANGCRVTLLLTRAADGHVEVGDPFDLPASGEPADTVARLVGQGVARLYAASASGGGGPPGGGPPP